MNSQLAQRPRRSEGGYILVTAMALVAVLLGVGLAFMRWSTDEAVQSRQVSGAMQAYYLGQMGVVENGFAWLKTRQEGDLPIGQVVLPGRAVPGVGQYKEVTIIPVAGESGGDFWTQNRTYRISAIGVADVPYYNGGFSETKAIKRKAVLYVSVRNFADYMYLSNNEKTNFGDVIKFWHEDTLNGRVHSNDTIAIMERPVFYDVVTTHAPVFWQGTGYNPEFHIPPIFRAPIVQIPEVAQNLRQFATNYYAPGIDKQMRIRIHGAQADVWTWPLGEALDTLTASHDQIPLGGGDKCIFTETPLEFFGIDITGSVTVGSAQLVRLMDDVRVAGPTSGTPEYRVSPSNTNYVGIVSEGQVKIANTWANGRENSNGPGFGQQNPAYTDIVINAAIVALGESFTFEQQNDPDSGYVCSCQPDDRGTIYLYGSLTQRRRGYVHRSNLGSSGYGKQYRYDSRFLRKRPPCFFEAVDSTGHALFDIVQWGGDNAQSPQDRQSGNYVKFN